MSVIIHKWTSKKLVSFNRHLKRYNMVNEILLTYGLESELIRVYLTDIGIFGGIAPIGFTVHKDQMCMCSRSRLDWNNIESVEFEKMTHQVSRLSEKKIFNVAVLRFKKDLREVELVIKQNCWYGNLFYKQIIRKDEFTLLLPENTIYLVKAMKILEEKVKI